MRSEDDFNRLYDFLRSRDRSFALEEDDREKFEPLLQSEMKRLWNDINEKGLIKQGELDGVKRIVCYYFAVQLILWVGP